MVKIQHTRYKYFACFRVDVELVRVIARRNGELELCVISLVLIGSFHLRDEESWGRILGHFLPVFPGVEYWRLIVSIRYSDGSRYSSTQSWTSFVGCFHNDCERIHSSLFFHSFHSCYKAGITIDLKLVVGAVI